MPVVSVNIGNTEGNIMPTTDKTLPGFSFASRLSPSSETTPTILSHEVERFSVADFHDPYEQLPTPGTEDRIRALLGFQKGTSLPNVNSETMLRYYRYLLNRLTLPFEALYSSDAVSSVSPVTVTGLVDPQTMPSDDRTGLCCIAYHRNRLDFLPLVDIEVEHDSPNFPLLEDYWFWLWNGRESRSYRLSKPR